MPPRNAEHKTQLTLYLPDSLIAELDRQRAANADRDELTRNAHAVFLLSRALRERAVSSTTASRRPATAGPRRRVPLEQVPMGDTRGTPFETEGARLKAARVDAGLTQTLLAVAVSAGSGPNSAPTSRQQVDRAERAATLDGYPALRAWLQGQAKAEP